jgi:GAF domain-containing protein
VLGLSLLNLQHKLIEANRLKSVEQWVEKGIVLFNQKIHEQVDSMDKFCEGLMSLIAQYIGVHYGVFYLREDNSLEMVLKATYAVDIHEVPQRRDMDSGLMEACIKDRSIMTLSNVPKDYIRINSGLGGGNPESVMIVPLQYGAATVGILEVASFDKFEKHHEQLLERIREQLANQILLRRKLLTNNTISV